MRKHRLDHLEKRIPLAEVSSIPMGHRSHVS